MSRDYRYKLETPRVTGRRQQKFPCPHCGRKSLVRYIDTCNDNAYIADEVGKCDHENSCGYHYKPSEYHRDHAWMQHGHSNSKLLTPNHQLKQSVPPPPPPLQPLPMELVARTHSPASTFWQWFATKLAWRQHLNPAIVQQIYEDYHVGATRRRNIIFWQIDRQRRVRSGHVMQYYSDGKRHDGYQNWVHTEKEFQESIPKNFCLYQCLYGEHLLPKRPDDQVCLVESEKTALVMAAVQPQYLWLATSGCGGLNAEKVECLRGRRIAIFPDSGCYEKWKKAMESTRGLSYTISDFLEQYPANTDLADLLTEPP